MKGRLEDRIHLGMQGVVLIETSTTRDALLLTLAPASLITVLETPRRSIVPGREELLLADDHSTDLVPQTDRP
ncbi:hypothetical protein LCGC14_1517440 [marine sediment metagenome]|uniref:Uncharacterized protein n=1 Tax=marine sediment metagenome TaxID=412755 RepID=A0A0F9JKG7_9ZZZZ